MRKFKKVSKKQYLTGFYDAILDMCEFTEDSVYVKDYEDIKLPKRATRGSAGYDCFAPFDIALEPGDDIKVPTGIKCFMEDDDVLLAFPRSGLGFKFRLQLNNTVGIIDSDYYYSSNEGHIFAKITNDTNEDRVVSIKKNTGFIQGIFLEYGITYDDEVSEIRDGGFGSTTK